MKTHALQRNIHISPQKAGLVCDLIRNKNIKNAINVLENTPKKSARLLLKLLNSAVANATNNHGMRYESLYVYNAIANKGTNLKRTFPRARGSADIIVKRYAHLEVTVSDDPQQKQKDLANIKKTTGPNPHKKGGKK